MGNLLLPYRSPQEGLTYTYVDISPIVADTYYYTPGGRKYGTRNIMQYK